MFGNPAAHSKNYGGGLVWATPRQDAKSSNSGVVPRGLLTIGRSALPGLAITRSHTLLWVLSKNAGQTLSS